MQAEPLQCPSEQTRTFRFNARLVHVPRLSRRRIDSVALFPCMAASPVSPCKRRPVRVLLPGMPPVTIRCGGGQNSSARLQAVSVTGGLLRVLKPLSPGAVVELMFSTCFGSVLAMAELLSPHLLAPIGLQPFRFIAMDNAELRHLCAAICIAMEDGIKKPICVPSGGLGATPEMYFLQPPRFVPKSPVG
jgi:hypothetical protein